MNEIDFDRVRYTVLGVFIVIFGLIIWYLNTDYHIHKEYTNFKKLEFKTTVSAKFDENPTRGNKIYLRNGPELIVNRVLFDQLKIGDSAIKKNDSDSIYFYTSNRLIIEDYNEFRRNKYLKSLE